MGINGLLPLLSPVTKTRHLSEFRLKRIGVDGYVWLHRIACRYAKEVMKHQSYEILLPYLMGRIETFVKHEIIPVVIFDGSPLPSKKITNDQRKSERTAALEKAMALESQGMSAESYSYFQKSVEINSRIVYTWIRELQKANIEYYVAPYEADAQLAYLCRTGYIDCVLTEDSDLLVYQTPLVLYKYDDSTNNVSSIEFQDVLNHLELTAEQFITMCILSGCDYVEHISQMGIKTALKMIKMFQGIDDILSHLANQPRFQVPNDWKDQFKRAFLTFQSQRVFDPRLDELTFVTPISTPLAPFYLGPEIAPDILNGIVKGIIDPRTFESVLGNPSTPTVSPYFPKKEPPRSLSSHTMIEDSIPKPKSPKPIQANKITSYFQLDPTKKPK